MNKPQLTKKIERIIQSSAIYTEKDSFDLDIMWKDQENWSAEVYFIKENMSDYNPIIDEKELFDEVGNSMHTGFFATFLPEYDNSIYSSDFPTPGGLLEGYISVHPDYRGQGLGRSFDDMLISICKELGVKTVLWMDPNQSFFKKLDYDIISDEFGEVYAMKEI